MRLEGTLDAFGLPDVLALLGVTGKTGALRLSHGPSTGEVLVRDGLVTGLDATGLARLLMWEEGDFAFDANAAVPPGDGVSHVELMDTAQSLAALWRSASVTLPEDSTVLALASGIAGPVTIDADQWALLSRIDGHRTIAVLCPTMDDRVQLAGLLQHGLVEPLARRTAFVAPEPRVERPAATAFTTSISVPSQPGSASGGYEVVGSLAMKPDMLLAPVAAPGIHDILLKRLVVSIRGL